MVLDICDRAPSTTLHILTCFVADRRCNHHVSWRNRLFHHARLSWQEHFSDSGSNCVGFKACWNGQTRLSTRSDHLWKGHASFTRLDTLGIRWAFLHLPLFVPTLTFAGIMFACSTLPAYMLAYFISIILKGMGFSTTDSLLLVSIGPFISGDPNFLSVPFAVRAALWACREFIWPQ